MYEFEGSLVDGVEQQMVLRIEDGKSKWFSAKFLEFIVSDPSRESNRI